MEATAGKAAYTTQLSADLLIVKMYYKIVDRFCSQDGEKWHTYLESRGLNLASFDSVDGILRLDLFEPESDEDWHNCVNENYKLSFITNLDYATRILNRYDNSVLVGVEIELEEGYVPKDRLLGFDIIDGYCDVSLVTNWGTDEEDIINSHVMPNGIICDFSRALQIRNLLRKKFSEDPHAENCDVWAIYSVDT